MPAAPKTFAILILSAMTLLFVAASSPVPRHQAFGLVRFGMSANAAAAAMAQITHPNSHPRHILTAADVRGNFVTSGSLRIARDIAFDRACQVNVSYKAEPFVNQITITSASKTAEGYDGLVKQYWEDFQDIGDSKFQRKTPKGEFPTVEAVQARSEELVTDTWEIEGIRIELSVRYYHPIQRPEAVHYEAALKATEIAETAAK